MINTDFIKILLIQLLTASPYLIVVALGFILSLVKYRECPRACLLTAIGTSVLFMARIAQIFVFQWLPYMAMQRNMNHTAMSQIYTVVGIVFTIVTSLALACIIVAVFVGRRKPAAANPFVRAATPPPPAAQPPPTNPAPGA